MEKRNIIVIGASSGSFELLKTIIKNLPPNFNASIFILWHMTANMRGVLPDFIN